MILDDLASAPIFRYQSRHLRWAMVARAYGRRLLPIRRYLARALSSAVPILFVTVVTFIGALLSVGIVGWLDVFDLEGFFAGREIGVGLLTGGLVGGALLYIDERREESMQRHSLAVAVAVKDDLRGIVLAGQDLRGVVLAGRDLTGADLRRARLAEADLTSATLDGANLRGADLSEARLDGVSAVETDFSDCTLTSASLLRAKLQRAKLVDANLHDASLIGADLRQADLMNADLSGTWFASVEMEGASLVAVDLAEADLGSADLAGVDLTLAHVSGARFGVVKNLDMARLHVGWISRRAPTWPRNFEEPKNVLADHGDLLAEMESW